MMSERACANESGQIEKLDRGGNRAEREREREREGIAHAILKN
jgi:hypothetical protein